MRTALVGVRQRLARGRVCILLGIGCLLAFFIWRIVDSRLAWIAWQRHAKELAARGAHLNWAEYFPPPVADKDNFALTPSLALLYDFIPETQEWRDRASVEKIAELGKTLGENAAARGIKIARFPSKEWNDRDPMNLPALLGHAHPTPDSAEDPPRTEHDLAQLLACLIQETHGQLLEELSRASARPFARFPVHYNHIPAVEMETPHLSVVRDCIKTLCLRACARLVLNAPEEAFKDLALALHLSDIGRNEPLEGAHSRRKICRRMIYTVILSGISRHAWSDHDLSTFESWLRKDDFIGEEYRALQILRAHYIGVIEQIGSGADRVTLSAVNSFTLLDELEWDACLFWAGHCASSGWYWHQALDYSQTFDKLTAPMASWSAEGCNAKQCLGEMKQRYAQFCDSKPSGFLATSRALWGRRLMTPMFIRDYSEDFADALRLQALTRLAIAGCGLERHFLQRNCYPDRLEEAVPNHLSAIPADPFTGAPLHYRRDAPNSCTLYSVGENFADDGGRVILKRNERVDTAKSDIVWLIPCK